MASGGRQEWWNAVRLPALRGWHWIRGRQELLLDALEKVEKGALTPLLKALVAPSPDTGFIQRVPFDPPATGEGLAWRLRAEYRLVPFHDVRRPLLDDLHRWAAGGAGVAAALLLGEGGSGKTRIAVELACRLAEQGWRAGRLEPEQVRSATERVLKWFLSDPQPTLLVLDYAERDLGLLGDILRAASRCRTMRLRLLMLARGQGDWWAELARCDADVQAVCDAAFVRRVGPLRFEGDERAVVFREALAAYKETPDAAEHVPSPDLSAPEFGLPLYLHMAALRELAGEDPGSASDLLSWVLNREIRAWRQAVVPSGEDWKCSLVERAAAWAVLVGSADGLTAAPAIYKTLPKREGSDLAEVRNLLERTGQHLLRMYPSGDAPGALRPDILGEELVRAELERDAAPLTAALAAERSEAQLVNAFTVLARLAARRPEEARWLDAALGTDPARLLAPALEAAKQFPEQLAGPLARAWEKLPDDQRAAVAFGLHGRPPEHTVALAPFALAVTEAAVAEARSRRDEARLAGLLNNLCVRLSALGRREEALSAIEEAVGLYRHLAEHNPDAFEPDLAGNLNNLCVRLAALGQHEEALRAIKEAVEIHRRLAKRIPDAFEPDLAMSLNNLSNCLANLGRRQKAFKATRKAVAIRRRLAERNPDAFEPHLAASLANLSNRLSVLGRREEALPAIEEAVAIYRRLAKRNPDAFEPDLAMSLNNLSVHLSELDRREEALSVVEEAVAICRRLAKRNPDAFEPDLAGSLNNLSVHLSALGRQEEALSAVEEAVAIWRRLAARDPDAFEPGLVRSLSVLADRLEELGRTGEAVAFDEEAVRTLLPHYLKLPQAHAELMAALADDYLRRCEALGREPDAELLAPIPGLPARIAGEDEPPAEPPGAA